MQEKEKISFCHLHVHTQYSLLDGFGFAENYVKRAKMIGFEYLGCTDHGSISGLIDFQKACKKEGVIPILGCELYIVPDLKIKVKGERRSHITVFLKNRNGWKNLCKILTIANIDGFYYRPRIGHKELIENLEGLVVLTGCVSSFLMDKRSRSFFDKIYKKIGKDLYFEIMPHNIPMQEENIKVVEKYKRTYPEIKRVATNDCHYINKEDWETQEVLLAIQDPKIKWDDPKRFRFGFKGLHLRTDREMVRAFKKQGFYNRQEIKEALENTIEIAEKCRDFKLRKRRPVLSSVPGIEEQDENTLLLKLCMRGFRKKFGQTIKGNKKYLSRLLMEFELIRKKEFSKYFLVVWDLCLWCRDNKIMIGPGRGSVGGSLIACLLEITSIDPLKFGLSFYRFISEDRVDFPDIDIDVEGTKVHLIRERLEEIYGKRNVMGVSNFLKMKSKAVLQDVSRVFDVPKEEVLEVTKQIDIKEERGIIDVVERTQSGIEFKENYPKVIDFALKLEGQVRGLGKHAAAIVISDGQIDSGGRGNLVRGAKGININWSKDDVEFMGMVKLDILSVDVLSIFNKTRQLIKENRKEDLVFEKIPLDDKKVLREIQKGNTVGAFHVGGWVTTRIIKEVNLKDFTTLATMLALARPGPLYSGMTDKFIKRSGGESWERKNPIYEEVTKETFGILAFQEQVMQVISRVAGMTETVADRIRKIIGKKRKTEEFGKYKEEFFDGCLERKTMGKKEAKDFWNGLMEWASYGFNKAHAIEYAMIGYWCSYCKYYYPEEFLCASLTYGSKQKQKKSSLVEEAYRLGLDIVPPKIGISRGSEWVVEDNKLYVPFIEVKGFGDKTVLAIEEVKNKKMSKDITGFFLANRKKRSNLLNKNLNKKTKRILKDIGAERETDVFSPVMNEYFDFEIRKNLDKKYPRLCEIVGEEEIKERFDQINKAEQVYTKEKLIKKKRFVNEKYNEKVLNCELCKLRSEATRPVLPSAGRYNIMIIGEAPGREEDKKEKGFVGKAGTDVLWPILKDYGMERRMFHISNIIKCFPSVSGTPGVESIEKCSLFLRKEIKEIDSRLILAFGNTSVRYFLGEKGGISALSGKTRWNEGIGAWICYCVHPASVLYNPEENESLFKKGIANFVETVKNLSLDRYKDLI